MADQAAALLRAGRLHEIVGVRPGATRAEVKKACQSARLRTHPDKQGGDTSLFRIVEDAVQQLLYEGPRFDGPTPGWAAQHIARIQEKQEDVEELQGVVDQYTSSENMKGNTALWEQLSSTKNNDLSSGLEIPAVTVDLDRDTRGGSQQGQPSLNNDVRMNPT